MKGKRVSVNKRVNAWLPIGIGITFVFAVTYVLIHQVIRQAADYPQVPLAQDAAYDLGVGKSPKNVIPAQTIDIRESPSPFMIVYDDAGKVLASSAQLDGVVPVVPVGVLDYTREHMEDKITWEPAPGVRMATVVMRFTEGTRGFVLVGRSLSEVEKRKELLAIQLGVAWVVTLGATFLFKHRA